MKMRMKQKRQRVVCGGFWKRMQIQKRSSHCWSCSLSPFQPHQRMWMMRTHKKVGLLVCTVQSWGRVYGLRKDCVHQEDCTRGQHGEYEWLADILIPHS